MKYNFIVCDKCQKIHKKKTIRTICECGNIAELPFLDDEYNFKDNILIEIKPNKNGECWKENKKLEPLWKEWIKKLIFKAKIDQEGEE